MWKRQLKLVGGREIPKKSPINTEMQVRDPMVGVLESVKTTCETILSGTQDAEISERVSCDIRCKTQPKEYTLHIGWLKTHSDQEGG